MQLSAAGTPSPELKFLACHTPLRTLVGLCGRAPQLPHVPKSKMSPHLRLLPPRGNASPDTGEEETEGGNVQRPAAGGALGARDWDDVQRADESERSWRRMSPLGEIRLETNDN